MQEEINEKTVALSIKSAKITSRVLAKAIVLALRHMNKRHKSQSSQKIYKGKQSLKQLSRNGSGLQNLEITEKNIKFFEPIARKYNIDYALHKDKSENPPRWLVFFKAKDTDVLTLAFKEFSAKALKKEKKRDHPTFKDLKRNHSRENINQHKVKIRERGGHER